MITPEEQQEITKFYYKRTREHIDRVKKYIDLIYNSDPKKFYLLQSRKELHDQSKYKKPELEPYKILTWKYHCTDIGKEFKTDKNTDHQIHIATYHHIKNNKHHPECWDENTTKDSLNSRDRDKPPDKMVDGTKMPEVDIAEMCADWCSMAEEKGTNPVEWAKKNINVRWRFNEDQILLIYKLLGLYKKPKRIN
jgi:hypothetical protein